MRTRSLGSAVAALGLSAQDVVTVSSSRPDEISLQNAAGGSLATSALRQCLLGDAVDADASGSVSAQELADCAQAKVDAALAGNREFSPPHITLAGNREFVPAWFANAVAPAVDAAPPAAPAAAPLARVLEQIHGQRDGKRTVSVVAEPARLRIGTEALRFNVSSSHAGQVYVAMLGSDGKTLYLLFPNALDTANSIRAGETLSLPRASWTLTAGGPPGTDKLLVLVADGARDLPALRGAKAGPFVQPLTDMQGRSQLQWLLGTSSRPAGAVACSGNACSDAFGAALLEIEEY